MHCVAPPSRGHGQCVLIVIFGDGSILIRGSSLYLHVHVVVEVVPSVIEPSFGIGRILYAALEHAFRVREDDEKRVWLSVQPAMAPISCSVLLLSTNEQFNPFITKIGKLAILFHSPQLYNMMLS